MSLSRGCVVVERQPGQWYCAVAHAEYDYEFRSYIVYGPRATEDAAFDFMSDYEANPGSSHSIPHAMLTERYKDLIDKGERAKFRGGFRVW